MEAENIIHNDDDELEQVVPPMEEIPEEMPALNPEPAPETEDCDVDAMPASEEHPDEEAEIARRSIRGKRIFRGAMRFYCFLYGGILAVLILLCCLMMPVRTWLTQYENAQPHHTAEAIYELLFAEPDWALLYDMAEVEGTDYEGRSAYVTYMEHKVGSQKLTYTQVAGNTSGMKRYSIRLGTEEVAAFTMQSYDDGVSTFPLWRLGDVEVFFTREESVTITKMPGYTVYINGVPLDESHTILYVNTLAENYLSEELDGYHYVQQKIDGLLIHPDVVVVDKNNNPLTLTQDPVTGIYSTEIPNTPEMSPEEYDIILAAAQAELQFAIRDISAAKLRQYFETGSPAYNAINDADPVLKQYQSYRFLGDATVIQDFYRYSDTVFSVRVKVSMEVTVKSNKTETVTVDTTYIFTQNNAGKYMVTESMDVDLQQIITSVLLNYECDGELLGSSIVDINDSSPAAPKLADREDSVFQGWGRLESDGNLTLILELQHNGLFQVAQGQVLAPMTLYPVYGAAGE